MIGARQRIGHMTVVGHPTNLDLVSVGVIIIIYVPLQSCSSGLQYGYRVQEKFWSYFHNLHILTSLKGC